MEKEVNIKARDRLKIQGILYERGRENLVIFLHGITGSIHEHHIKTGIEFFYNKNYSVYAYNQYSDETLNKEKPRALYDKITIDRHIEDLEDVYDYFKNQYENIYLVGHSLGGLTILIANIPCKAQSLWDPSAAEPFSKKIYTTYKGLFAKQAGGKIAILNNNLEKNKKYYNIKRLVKICEKIKTPTHIIGASKAFGPKNIVYSKYISNCLFESMEADHNFTKLGQVKEICEKAYKWFKQNS